MSIVSESLHRPESLTIVNDAAHGFWQRKPWLVIGQEDQPALAAFKTEAEAQAFISDRLEHFQKLADDTMQLPIEPVQRELSITEDCGDAFKCTHCRAMVKDGAGYLVSIVENGVGIPVDGKFCCWNHAEDEAREAVIVDAK